MDCKFFVGQQVTLISDDPWGVRVGDIVRRTTCPEFGRAYTIIGFDVCEGPIGLLFAELENRYLDTGDIIYRTPNGGGGGYYRVSECHKVGFAYDKFRPVSKRSTDTGMEVLKKIALTGKLPAQKKQKESA